MSTTFEELSFQGAQTSGRVAAGGVDSGGSFHLVAETRRVDGDSMSAGKSWWCRARSMSAGGEDLAPRGRVGLASKSSVGTEAAGLVWRWELADVVWSVPLSSGDGVSNRRDGEK